MLLVKTFPGTWDLPQGGLGMQPHMLGGSTPKFLCGILLTSMEPSLWKIKPKNSLKKKKGHHPDQCFLGFPPPYAPPALWTIPTVSPNMFSCHSKATLAGEPGRSLGTAKVSRTIKPRGPWELLEWGAATLIREQQRGIAGINLSCASGFFELQPMKSMGL